MSKREILAQVDFGQRTAEEESAELGSYFVVTDNWDRLFNGEIDVVYGPKGSGKSALYSLLLANSNSLFDRSVLLAAGENPRGAPAFGDLVGDPPVSEREFVGLWKLYIASLLSAEFDELGLESEAARELRDQLEREGLVRGKRTLQAMVRATFGYVKRFFRPNAVEGTVNVDPHTQMPTGFTGKISFEEPDVAREREGHRSVDSLLALADRALMDAGLNVWVLLDRLDVAFAESQELEQNALRALFRVYLDLKAHPRIVLKIFLRTDIWRRITDGGFREASHIIRTVTIDWDRSSLVNLIVRRLLHNAAIRDNFDVDAAQVLESLAKQEEFFYRVFPAQVDEGGKKPSSVDWILSRTRDGTQKTAPREVIHLISALRVRQIQRYELGSVEPDGESLFERQAFKEALPEVSAVRLTQTLYAEYPGLKQNLERLRGAKTSQSVDTLAAAWKLPPDGAHAIAEQLVDVGFFERRGDRDAPEYWVPFLYRDALDLVQGAAD